MHREGLLQVAKELLEQEKRFAPEECTEEKAYLDACIEAQFKREQDRRRLVRGAIVSLSVVLATVSGLAVWAVNNAREARRQEDRTQLQAAKVTALTADALLAAGGGRRNAVFAALQSRRQMQGIDNPGADIFWEVSSALHASTTRLRYRQRLEGHTSWVNAVAYNPDGETLASASDDGTVRLWTREGNPLATLEGHTSWVRAVEFSLDGEMLASASRDGTVRLWYLNPDRLVALACRQLWDDIQITDRLEDADREFCQEMMDEYPNQPWEPLP